MTWLHAFVAVLHLVALVAVVLAYKAGYRDGVTQILEHAGHQGDDEPAWPRRVAGGIEFSPPPPPPPPPAPTADLDTRCVYVFPPESIRCVSSRAPGLAVCARHRLPASATSGVQR